MIYRVFNIGGLNLKINPMLQKAGGLIRCVNFEDDMVGTKKKRPGYTTYLTSLSQSIDTFFSWRTNTGTQFWNYAASGGTLFYSTQGTGAWTVCGNGTFAAGSPVGNVDVRGTLMMIGDSVGTSRYTTDGTSFTDVAAAQKSNQFVLYQNRIYALGSSSLDASATGTFTDWTTDLLSEPLPFGGGGNNLFKAADRVIMTSKTGEMARWDGYNLVDLATDLGPSSKFSIGDVEDYRIYLNRVGYFGFGGGKPELISNPIEKQIYNDKGSGIVGTTFDNAPGIVHNYDYLCAVGTVTDDLTDETINRCIQKYNFQQDEWSNWEFANLPTAFGTYIDENSNKQLIFGDGTGQCYTYGGTNVSDNGVAISAVMEGVLHFGEPETDKKFNYFTVFANPGCEAEIQVAIGDTFTNAYKKWQSIGDFHDGIAELRFPGGSEGKLLFWKVIESSANARFHLYGFSIDANPLPQRK